MSTFEDFIRKYLRMDDTTIDKIITIVDEALPICQIGQEKQHQNLTLIHCIALQESDKFGLLLGDGTPPTLFLDLVESASKSLGEYHISEGDDEDLYHHI